MQKKYSQTKALLAITKASLLAILKSPSSLLFSLIFPLLFVWIFSFFGSGGPSKIKISMASQADTSNVLYNILQAIPNLKIEKYATDSLQKQDLEKGRIAAIVNIQTSQDSTAKPVYNVKLRSTNASVPELAQLIPIFENISLKLNPQANKNIIIEKDIYSVREYKQIDFILPGQLGFSILFSTLFGIAFSFFALREQLVLKRFYASPVNRINILLGIGFSRLFFQLLNIVVLIVVGRFWLGFTLAHGFVTFIEMILMSILLLLVLMGVGLLFSSFAKSDNTIPMFINIFAMPQMLMSGVFFSIAVFPTWMQSLCKIFPLTHFTTAVRKISFEGAGLADVWQDIAVIGIWGVVVYVLVYKFFKWE